MFVQGKTAVGYVPEQQLGLLGLKLAQAGYEQHAGPKVQREGEVATYRKPFQSAEGYRQCHVQLVVRGDVYALYAHTEPHTNRGWAHAVSAVGDGASFSGGSRMLRGDLAKVGFELLSYAEAKDSVRRRQR